MKEKQERLIKLVSAKIVFGLLSFLCAVYIFGAIAHAIFHHREESLDAVVFNYLSAYTTDTLISWMRVITFFGKPHFLIPAYLMLIFYFIWKKNKSLALELGIIGTSSTALSFLLKFIFKRERPSIQVLDYLGGY